MASGKREQACLHSPVGGTPGDFDGPGSDFSRTVSENYEEEKI
jgi:hypothetical protein